MRKILFILSCCTMFLFVGCAKDEVDLTGSIKGLVTDYSNANEPIAGATITLNSKGYTKTTGSDGRFEFSNLEAGTYSVSASADKYQSTTKQVTIYAGTDANCDFQLSKSVSDVEISPLTLAFGVNVEQLSFSIKNNNSTSLTYSISNQPDYVEISPKSGTVASKASQAVSVHVLNRSSITSDKTGQITVNVGNDSFIVSISVSGNTTYEETKTGKVEGRVIASSDRSSISGATVILMPGNQKKTTDSDGFFSFGDVDAGTYKLEASKSQYTTQTVEITVNAGATTSSTIMLDVAKAQLKASTSTIDFGTDLSSFTMSLSNSSSTSAEWKIGTTLPSWLSASPSSGSITAGNSGNIKFTVDRSSVTSNASGTIRIAGNFDDVVVSYSISKKEDNGGNTGGGSTSTMEDERIIGNWKLAFNNGASVTSTEYYVFNSDYSTGKHIKNSTTTSITYSLKYESSAYYITIKENNSQSTYEYWFDSSKSQLYLKDSSGTLSFKKVNNI